MAWPKGSIELGHQLPSGLKAFAHIEARGPGKPGVKPRRNGTQPGWHRALRIAEKPSERRNVIGEKRMDARQAFACDNCEAPEVVVTVTALAANLLGAHVPRGADHLALDSERSAVDQPEVKRFGEAEIEHLCDNFLIVPH
jgi:hypothetical protein